MFQCIDTLFYRNFVAEYKTEENHSSPPFLYLYHKIYLNFGKISRHKVEFLFCLCYNNEKAKLRYIFYIIWNITLGNKSLLFIPFIHVL